MNYRHAYHAGNHADVLKHAVLARIVEHLKCKEKSFRVIDIHAGAGVYDLEGLEAGKTGEWRSGIGRVVGAAMSPEAATVLRPYLDVVRDANTGAELQTYPGSPALIRALLRPQDRLTAIELHPEDSTSLKLRFAGDFQTRVIELDGWLALGAHVPPKERRGLVLIDPPFEKEGEWRRLLDGLAKAYRRWPSGTYLLWYPEKDRTQAADFRMALRDLQIPKILDIGLTIRAPLLEPRLDGSGLVVVNPPFTLAGEMGAVLPELARLLADRPGGSCRIGWIAGEPGA